MDTHTPATYGFSKFCVWGLTGSCAALALIGVLGMFGAEGATFFGLDRVGWCVLALASVMAFAIVNVNNMAEAAMQAIDVRVEPRDGETTRAWLGRSVAAWHWPTLIPATICGIGFAVASNIGVHLGWEILIAAAAHPERLPTAETVGRIFLFLSAAKPLSMLAVAGRQAMNRAAYAAAAAASLARLDAKDTDRLERQAAADAERRRFEHEERMAAIGARPDELAAPEPAAEPAPVKAGNVTSITVARPKKHNGAKIIVATATGLGAGQAATADAPPDTRPARQGAEIVAQAHAGADPQVARAMALKGQRKTRIETATLMDVSERTVTRLWAKGEAANAAALGAALAS